MVLPPLRVSSQKQSSIAETLGPEMIMTSVSPSSVTFSSAGSLAPPPLDLCFFGIASGARGVVDPEEPPVLLSAGRFRPPPPAVAAATAACFLTPPPTGISSNTSRSRRDDLATSPNKPAGSVNDSTARNRLRRTLLQTRLQACRFFLKDKRKKERVVW